MPEPVEGCQDCYYNPQCKICENCLVHCTCNRQFLGEFTKKNSRLCTNCGDTNGDIETTMSGTLRYRCDTCGYHPKIY